MPSRATPLHARALLAATLALLTSACVSNPDGGCPRAGVETARRCKRLCVLDPGRTTMPLSCTCMAECMCWQMPGHSRPLQTQ